MENISFELKELLKQREIFARDEINAFLDCIPVKDFLKKAVFELMYSSGLRVSEIVNLNLSDIDLSERTLAVREGKGSKDRFVPFSEVACMFLKRYIDKGRKGLGYREDDALFLTEYGRISGSTIRKYFGEILKRANITRKHLTVHSIRHTCATHLLESGADVRYVQELLGHETIETTVKYTHLMMENLKRAYKSGHPRENEYYEEVDAEYLENIDKLKSEILLRREINRRYT